MKHKLTTRKGLGDTMCQQVIARLPCTPPSIRSARSLVLAEFEAWGAAPPDVARDRVADAVLVVSELVTNAVRLGTRDVELLLVAHRDRIEISVTDDNPQPAELKKPDPLMPGGRGLLLINALADQWGQRPNGRGKTVWARLSLPPGSALGRNCTLPVN